MSQNLLIIVCEGRHDTEFIARLLKERKNGKRVEVLNKLPLYLNKHISSIIQTRYKTPTKIFERPELLPIVVKVQQANEIDIFVCLYGIGGTSRSDRGAKIIENFKDILQSELYPEKPQKVAFAFGVDADNKAAEIVLEKLKNDYQPYLENHPFADVDYFILKDAHVNSGDLESILVPLMREGYEEAFDAAEVFVDTYGGEKIASSTNTEDSEKLKADFKRKKAVLGIMGNLQNSGIDNGNTIKQATFWNGKFTDEKSPQCKDLMQMFEKLFAALE